MLSKSTNWIGARLCEPQPVGMFGKAQDFGAALMLRNCCGSQTRGPSDLGNMLSTQLLP